MKTLFKGATVITMDLTRNEKYEILDILIEDDIIKTLSKNYTGYYDKIIDCKGKIIMPGLINAHTHLGMSIFRNTNDNLPLMKWLQEKTWPVEAKLTSQDIYIANLTSLVEAILTGTTCVADHYIADDITIKAIIESKIRCLYTNFLKDNDNLGNKRLNDFNNLYNKYKDYSDLITFSLAPHSMYTCSKEYLRKISNIAKYYNLPIHIHYAESLNEVQMIENDYKTNIYKALKETYLLNNKLILAHGIYIPEENLNNLKNYDISIVHNPISNLALGSGILNIKKLLNNNINVCLGTDGDGSSFNINMFYHMSYVDLLQKGYFKDANILNSYDVLKMATINGAHALELDDKIGSIKEGKKADIIMLDLSDITIYPENNLISQVVHNTNKNNIVMTMVNGNILALNGKLQVNIDVDNLKKEIDNIIKRFF